MQNKNIGSITIIYIQGDQTRNTILISLSLSINIIALLFIWQANQYKGGKEPQEIQKRRKKSREKEKKGKQKGIVNTTRSTLLLLILLLHLAMHGPTRARSDRARPPVMAAMNASAGQEPRHAR